MCEIGRNNARGGSGAGPDVIPPAGDPSGLAPVPNNARGGSGPNNANGASGAGPDVIPPAGDPSGLPPVPNNARGGTGSNEGNVPSPPGWIDGIPAGDPDNVPGDLPETADPTGMFGPLNQGQAGALFGGQIVADLSVTGPENYDVSAQVDLSGNAVAVGWNGEAGAENLVANLFFHLYREEGTQLYWLALDNFDAEENFTPGPDDREWNIAGQNPAPDDPGGESEISGPFASQIFGVTVPSWSLLTWANYPVPPESPTRPDPATLTVNLRRFRFA